MWLSHMPLSGGGTRQGMGHLGTTCTLSAIRTGPPLIPLLLCPGSWVPCGPEANTRPLCLWSGHHLAVGLALAWLSPSPVAANCLELLLITAGFPLLLDIPSWRRKIKLS